MSFPAHARLSRADTDLSQCSIFSDDRETTETESDSSGESYYSSEDSAVEEDMEYVPPPVVPRRRRMSTLSANFLINQRGGTSSEWKRKHSRSISLNEADLSSLMSDTERSSRSSSYDTSYRNRSESGRERTASVESVFKFDFEVARRRSSTASSSDINLPYHLQGDAIWDTEDNKGKRNQLKDHPAVRDAILLFLSTYKMNEDGFIGKTEYIAAHKRVQRALFPLDLYDEATANMAAEEDWIHDGGESGGISESMLYDSIFEIADMWTDDVQPEHYANFLFKLHHRVTRSTVSPSSPQYRKRASTVEGLLNRRTSLQLNEIRVRSSSVSSGEFDLRRDSLEERSVSPTLSTKFELADEEEDEEEDADEDEAETMEKGEAEAEEEEKEKEVKEKEEEEEVKETKSAPSVESSKPKAAARVEVEAPPHPETREEEKEEAEKEKEKEIKPPSVKTEKVTVPSKPAREKPIFTPVDTSFEEKLPAEPGSPPLEDVEYKEAVMYDIALQAAQQRSWRRLDSVKNDLSLAQWTKTEKQIINTAVTFPYKNISCGGLPALFTAARLGHSKKISTLVYAQGADPNGLDRFGMTPLIHASGGGHLDAVNELLKVGADINMQDLALNTPLHHACFRQRKDVAVFLMENGAKRILNALGKAPNTADLFSNTRGEVLKKQVEILKKRGKGLNEKEFRCLQLMRLAEPKNYEEESRKLKKNHTYAGVQYDTTQQENDEVKKKHYPKGGRAGKRGKKSPPSRRRESTRARSGSSRSRSTSGASRSRSTSGASRSRSTSGASHQKSGGTQPNHQRKRKHHNKALKPVARPAPMPRIFNTLQPKEPSRIALSKLKKQEQLSARGKEDLATKSVHSILDPIDAPDSVREIYKPSLNRDPWIITPRSSSRLEVPPPEVAQLMPRDLLYSPVNRARPKTSHGHAKQLKKLTSVHLPGEPYGRPATAPGKTSKRTVVTVALPCYDKRPGTAPLSTLSFIPEARRTISVSPAKGFKTSTQPRKKESLRRDMGMNRVEVDEPFTGFMSRPLLPSRADPTRSIDKWKTTNRQEVFPNTFRSEWRL